MPLFAAEMERNYGVRATVLASQPDQNAEENIPGLEALAKADLAVLYLRWRRLPPDQLARLGNSRRLMVTPSRRARRSIRPPGCRGTYGWRRGPRARACAPCGRR